MKMSKQSFILIFVCIFFNICHGQVTRFNTKKGPKAIGPYSTVSIYRGVAYVSGQIGLDPETGELVGPDVESQTKRVMENIHIILD